MQQSQRLLYPLQRFGIKMQKTLSQPYNLSNHIGRNLALTYLHGILYQRNGESLAAIPQVSHITTFRLQKSGRDFFLFSVFRKKFAIFMLHLFEIFL